MSLKDNQITDILRYAIGKAECESKTREEVEKKTGVIASLTLLPEPVDLESKIDNLTILKEATINLPAEVQRHIVTGVLAAQLGLRLRAESKEVDYFNWKAAYQEVDEINREINYLQNKVSGFKRPYYRQSNRLNANVMEHYLKTLASVAILDETEVSIFIKSRSEIERMSQMEEYIIKGIIKENAIHDQKEDKQKLFSKEKQRKYVGWRLLSYVGIQPEADIPNSYENQLDLKRREIYHWGKRVGEYDTYVSALVFSLEKMYDTLQNPSQQIGIHLPMTIENMFNLKESTLRELGTLTSEYTDFKKEIHSVKKALSERLISSQS